MRSIIELESGEERMGDKEAYNDGGVGVEEGMRLAAANNLVHVDIHAAIISPVIGAASNW